MCGGIVLFFTSSPKYGPYNGFHRLRAWAKGLGRRHLWHMKKQGLAAATRREREGGPPSGRQTYPEPPSAAEAPGAPESPLADSAAAATHRSKMGATAASSFA